MNEVTDYLNSKSVSFKQSGNEVILQCPNCGKDKLYINTISGKYRCHRCNAKEPNNLYANGHINKLKEEWGDVIAIQSVSQKIEPDSNIEIDYTNEVDIFHKNLLQNKRAIKYLLKRGLSEQTIERFKLGYTRKFNQEWISIPSYENGIPKLLKYRKLPPDQNKELAKYIREEGGKSILFNGDILDEYDEILLCEGEMDTISLLENGYENVVGITAGAGSLLPEWYDKLIMKEKIYLILDPDSAGQTSAKETWATRLGFNKCWNVILPKYINDKECDINLYFKYYNKEDFDKLLQSATRFQIDGLVSIDDALYSFYQSSKDEDSTAIYELPWPSVNRILNGGLKKTRLTTIGGIPGCIGGDSKLDIKHIGEKSIAGLYNIFTEAITANHEYFGSDTMSYKGNSEIGYHGIRQVVYCGKKPVYEVTSLKGNKIEVTKDHMFKTHNDIYSSNDGYEPLSNLKEGSFVLTRKGNGLILDFITSIRYAGVKDTFDLIMYDPYRNYIANNFLVHNSGKTTMAMQILYHFAKKYDMPSLMFNMEMHETSLVTKIVQLNNDLIEAEVDPTNALIYAMELKDLPIYLGYSPKITPDIFYNTMKMARDRYGVQIGVFDNLQRLIRTGEEADMARASGMFKDITMDLNMMFILISQPRKRASGDDSLPTFQELKGSSALPADSDEIILLHRKRLGNKSGSLDPITKIIVDKSRFSAGGMIRLNMIGEKARFEELSDE